MALAGAPSRTPRYAFLVGSNPAVTRVLRTYLQREGVLCREATPESVLRAVSRYEAIGVVDGLYAEAVAVALVVASAGIDVTRIREALISLPATAKAPVLMVDSLAGTGDGMRLDASGSQHPTLAWPFRLRDVMDAITAAMAVHDGPPSAVRLADPGSPLRVASQTDVVLVEVASGVSRP